MGKVVKFKKPVENYIDKSIVKDILTTNMSDFLYHNGRIYFYEDLEDAIKSGKIFYMKGFSIMKFIELKELLILAAQAGRITNIKLIKDFIKKDYVEVPKIEKVWTIRTDEESMEIQTNRLNQYYDKVGLTF